MKNTLTKIFMGALFFGLSFIGPASSRAAEEIHGPAQNLLFEKPCDYTASGTHSFSTFQGYITDASQISGGGVLCLAPGLLVKRDEESDLLSLTVSGSVDIIGPQKGQARIVRLAGMFGPVMRITNANSVSIKNLSVRTNGFVAAGIEIWGGSNISLSDLTIEVLGVNESAIVVYGSSLNRLSDIFIRMRPLLELDEGRGIIIDRHSQVESLERITFDMGSLEQVGLEIEEDVAIGELKSLHFSGSSVGAVVGSRGSYSSEVSIGSLQSLTFAGGDGFVGLFEVWNATIEEIRDIQFPNGGEFALNGSEVGSLSYLSLKSNEWLDASLWLADSEVNQISNVELEGNSVIYILDSQIDTMLGISRVNQSNIYSLQGAVYISSGLVGVIDGLTLIGPEFDVPALDGFHMSGNSIVGELRNVTAYNTPLSLGGDGGVVGVVRELDIVVHGEGYGAPFQISGSVGLITNFDIRSESPDYHSPLITILHHSGYEGFVGVLANGILSVNSDDPSYDYIYGEEYIGDMVDVTFE